MWQRLIIYYLSTCVSRLALVKRMIDDNYYITHFKVKMTCRNSNTVYTYGMFSVPTH